jgi:hypothetical protein
MSIPFTFALSVVMAAASDNYEWKGSFYTPDVEYQWIAQMTATGAGPKGYVDPSMTIALIPAENQNAAALEAVTGAGNAAMADEAACEVVNDGGTLTPATDKCYKLMFDQTKSESVFKVAATGVNYIAFFAQHLPTEFEDTKHYFKDTTHADIEPGAQAPEPAGGDGAGHGHGHGGGEGDDAFSGLCVCQAESHGWRLDCSNMEPVTTAVAALKANNACKKGNPPQTCVDNYFIMQAHHDHCLHDVLPTNIEKDLHDYEHFYMDCFVKRQYNTDLPKCDKVECGGNAVTTAISKLNQDCNTKEACKASTCPESMRTVLMAHDTCAEETLPNNLETTLHDHEEDCEEHLCNSAEAEFNPYDDPCSASTDANFCQHSVVPMTFVLWFALCLVPF